MFWDKKNEKGKLPDLPPMTKESAPQIKVGSSGPTFIPQKPTSQNLPSFPDSPSHNSFSQAAIKDAVNNEPEEGETINSNSGNFKATEMEEWTPSRMPDPPKAKAMPAEPRAVPMPQMKKAPVENDDEIPVPRKEAPAKDIFVKIEKFRSVRNKLDETKDKLEEVDDLLAKIRETRMREEQELTAWEKEIGNARARIQEVNSNIFEKLS